MELDGGVIVAAGDGAVSGSPAVVVQMPPARAHALAHLLGEWAELFRLAPDQGDEPSAYALSQALEDVAAGLEELGALACASRAAGSVPVEQRLAAVQVLREREPALSARQRIAVVDAAARWMDEESAGEELAYALLGAVCSSETITNHAYLTLLSPRPVDDPEADR